MRMIFSKRLRAADSSVFRKEAEVRPASQRAFTLVEMLVVIGIIGMIAAMSLPLYLGMMRGRKVEQAADIVKSACLQARSMAIAQKRMINVTLLEQERVVIITHYDDLRDNPYPPDKPAGDSQKPYCAHNLGNYSGKPDARYEALAARCTTYSRRKVRELPEGCRFDLDGDGFPADNSLEPQGWTYVFLPNGNVWSLPPLAVNDRGGWSETTYKRNPSDTRPSGPVVYGPGDADADKQDISRTIVVFAMTGQATDNVESEF